MRRLAPLVAALWLVLPTLRAHADDDPYAKLVPLAGDSHQHAATLYMIQRQAKQPPVPGFGQYLHENCSASDVYDELRKGGYDWGSLSHHDTNHPGLLANICIDPASAKYQWWIANVSPSGFPDATKSGAAVSPPSNEALALSRVADSKNVEGKGGFLAFTGREFTNVNFNASSVAAREAGHKVVILPRDTTGMCTADGLLMGDEYCKDEAHLYLWIASQRPPWPVLIQAHPGPAESLNLSPFHPKNAPGGFTDQFIEGMEVSSKNQDPQWEPAYQRALHLGYRLFPAYGSDNHFATYKGNEPSPAVGATICWSADRTRAALVEAMHQRRCYYATSWKPELRFSARAHGAAEWTVMGGELMAPKRSVDVRIGVANDRRNFDANPQLGKRFDTLQLVDDAGAIVAACGLSPRPPAGASECRCTRAPDGADTCALSVDSLALHDGAFYPRVLMSHPDPNGCRSKATPIFLPGCSTVIVGAPIFVNWSAFQARTPYRACRIDPSHLPCGEPGCLPKEVDRDQDGWPDDCDVCPNAANPDQADRDQNGYGDVCARPAGS
jgi:hypothetical protein